MDKKEKNQIEQRKKRNKNIEDAVLVAQMMEMPGYAIMRKEMDETEKAFRFQDILAVKDNALQDQKGIVMGIKQIQNYLDGVKKLAETPRVDPETGEKEKMNNAE